MYNNNSININVCVLRILATLFVVLLHSCSTILANQNIFSVTSNQTTFFMIMEKLFCFAVPIFFMISGELLLGNKKRFTYSLIIKKYVLRIFLALILFGFIYCSAKTYIETKTFSIILIIKSFICNEGFEHMWYLYTLLGIYFILPLIKAALQEMETKDIIILLFLIFIFDFCISTISDIIHWNIAFKIPLTYPIFYFIFGYYIDLIKNYKKFQRVSILIIIMSFCSICLINLYKNYCGIIWDYDSPFTAIYSIAIYLFFYKIDFSLLDFKTTNLIWKIDRLCFGVYLIHPIIIQFTYRFLKILPYNFHLYPLVTFMFFILFSICSFLISFILNKIKLFKRYIL